MDYMFVWGLLFIKAAIAVLLSAGISALFGCHPFTAMIFAIPISDIGLAILGPDLDEEGE